ncbi:MAG: type II toxin-antitoxin system HicA family toxin [Novosphingobium sp.]
MIKDLEKAGWSLDRVSGSHHIFVKHGMLSISVPHPRTDLGRGIEHALRKAAGLK